MVKIANLFLELPNNVSEKRKSKLMGGWVFQVIEKKKMLLGISKNRSTFLRKIQKKLYIIYSHNG